MIDPGECLVPDPRGLMTPRQVVERRLAKLLGHHPLPEGVWFRGDG